MRHGIAVICILFAASINAEEVYRWQDADGRWHFGDSTSAPEASQLFEPPPNQSWITIAPVAPMPPLQSHKPEALETQSEHPQLRERKSRKTHCEKLRNNMSKFGQGFRGQQDRYDRECVLPWQR